MKKLLVVVLLFLLIGFADTVYLSISASVGGSVACYIVEGCDLVLSSSYNNVAGIPLATVGVAYYTLALIFFLIVLKRRRFWSHIFLYALGGFIVSLYLLYVQFFVLHALCSLCIVSALVSTGFATTTFLLQRRKSPEHTSSL